MAKEKRSRKRDTEIPLSSGSSSGGLRRNLLLSLLGICLFLVASSMYLLQPLDDQKLIFLQQKDQPIVNSDHVAGFAKIDLSRVVGEQGAEQRDVEEPEAEEPEAEEPEAEPEAEPDADPEAEAGDVAEAEAEGGEQEEENLVVPKGFKGVTLPRPAEKEMAAEGRKPNAYVNLCVDDKYVFYTIVLFHMLAKVDAHGVFVVMVHSISDENHKLFESLGIRVFQTHGIDVDLAFAKGSEARDKKLFSKLRVWELDEFEKIVLLDSDILVVGNIDELFDMPEFTASPLIMPEEKISFYVHTPGFFTKKYQRARAPDMEVGKFGANSGITVLKPDQDTFQEMMDVLKIVVKRLCCPSQEFLYHFFMEKEMVHPLPFKFHYRLRTRVSKELRKELDKTFKVYHFVERAKPWLQRDVSKRTRLARRWWEHKLETMAMLEGMGVNSTALGA